MRPSGKCRSERHPSDHLAMILDGTGWLSSHALKVHENIKLLPLPPCAPELNPVEHLWDELREKHFDNLAFDSLDALEDHSEQAVNMMESNHAKIKSIVHWRWTLHALWN